MSGGFCHLHQRALNEFGWCESCGEPRAVIPPAVPQGATSALSRGLAKLRRSTELALGYPVYCVGRAEAHAILSELERLRVRCDQQERALRDASERLGLLTTPPFTEYTHLVAEVRDSIRASLVEAEGA